MVHKLNIIIRLLDGRKTYLTALAIAVLNLLVAFNAISPTHLAQINIVLGALGLGALRQAVGKNP